MMSQKQGVTVYYSSVSGNTLWTKHTDRVEFLLSANKIPFQSIDVSTDPEALQYMKRQSQLKNIGQLPQVFRDGQFIGGKEELDEANEYGELKQLLGLEAVQIPPPELSAMPAQSGTSDPSATSNSSSAATQQSTTTNGKLATPPVDRSKKPSPSAVAKPSCPQCGMTQTAEWQKKCPNCNQSFA